MRKLLPVILVAVGVYAWQQFQGSESGDASVSGARPVASELTQTSPRSSGSNAILARAYKDRRSGIQVEGAGVVTRVMSDDNDGSRHQRFILDLGSGQTLLIAHNIDLAPRAAGIREGDRVRFYGEYEWNGQGGVIHWTHNDPAGQHVAGWLEYQGRRFQ